MIFAFYEFFAGGGMARLGLGRRWQCTFANDWDKTKAKVYRANFRGAPELLVKDVRGVQMSDLPDAPILAWASFPCQDLSLAGNRAGLDAERSGTFWPFWRLMEDMATEGRALPLIVIENVAGLLTSNGGQDFALLLKTFLQAGYRGGALVIDAVRFVPQSRSRLFLVMVREDIDILARLVSPAPDPIWHPENVRAAYMLLEKNCRSKLVWWRLPAPPPRHLGLSDLVEDEPTGVSWHSQEETARLLKMMSAINLRKVEEAKSGSLFQPRQKRVVGTIYKRIRKGVQRAEVRFDDVSGCLRTPVGGSSRQTIIIVEGQHIRTRLLSPREATRLMGIPDSYTLPESYNDAYHLAGDGVVVPVVAHLERHLLRTLAKALREKTAPHQENVVEAA